MSWPECLISFRQSTAFETTTCCALKSNSSHPVSCSSRHLARIWTSLPPHSITKLEAWMRVVAKASWVSGASRLAWAFNGTNRCSETESHRDEQVFEAGSGSQTKPNDIIAIRRCLLGEGKSSHGVSYFSHVYSSLSLALLLAFFPLSHYSRSRLVLDFSRPSC